MSAAEPRVSVMIPAYNRAGLLGAAIDSVLAQTFDDFEIIVVDDESTEDIRAVTDRYGDRVRYARIAHAGMRGGIALLRVERQCGLGAEQAENGRGKRLQRQSCGRPRFWTGVSAPRHACLPFAGQG